jgi:hypothetical protein
MSVFVSFNMFCFPAVICKCYRFWKHYVLFTLLKNRARGNILRALLTAVQGTFIVFKITSEILSS